MKKIVCELCEGTVFDKVDGRFVCKGCGTSYSVEEAKSMMQEVEGDEPVSAGSPVVSAPQSGINQQQLDNILMLASSAYEADNKAEAENYCNQAIVIDAMCYKAWFLKGKAVGWQSAIGNLRIEEAAHSFCKAIDFAPEEEKEDLKSQASDELRNLGLALISLRKKRFISSPDKEELNGFASDKKVVLDALLVLLSHGNIVPIPEGYLEQVATLMNEAGVGAINTVRKVWNEIEYPGHRDWQTYIGWMGNIAEVFRQAIDTSDEDDEEDITRYKNLIIVLEEPIDSCSYTRQWSSYSSSYINVKEYTLTDEAKAARRKEVQKCKDEIKNLEKKIADKKAAEAKKAEEEKKARIDAYWEAHAEEKEALESEKKELVEKRDALQKDLNEVNSEIQTVERMKNEDVPSEAEKRKIEDQIRDLNNRRAKLGMFAGKEKKQIAEEIASLEGRIDSLKGKIEEEKKEKAAEVDKRLAPAKARKNELDSELAPITKRISAIDAELTKDPEA